MNARVLTDDGKEVATVRDSKISFVDKDFGARFKKSMFEGVPSGPDAHDELDPFEIEDVLAHLGQCGFDVRVDSSSPISEDSSMSKGDLRVSTQGDTFHEKQRGLVASLIATTERAQGQAIEREQKKNEFAEAAKQSKHVGNVGDRLAGIHVTVQRVIDRPSDFGVTRIHQLVDDAGNHYTWFASGGGGFKQGDEVTIKGTVKGHGEFNGMKQTTLARVQEDSKNKV